MFDFFTDKLKLNEWDWLAVIIAVSALLVSFLSLIIARNTLRSQRQTEKNTTPLINKSVQSLLLNDVITTLFFGYIKIKVLNQILKKRKYTFYPTEDILEEIIIDPSTIHLEIFFNDTNNYTIMKALHKIILHYNVQVKMLNKHLSDTLITTKLIQNEIFELTVLNEQVAQACGFVLSNIYNLNPNETFKYIFKYILDNTLNVNNSIHQINIIDETCCYMQFLKADTIEPYILSSNKLAYQIMELIESKLIKKISG